MTRLLLALAAALLVPAARAKDKPASARRCFLAGVEAHLKGHDAAAARDWVRCLALAAKGSDDESDCRLFSDMLREQRAPNAPVPDERSAARRAYVEGRKDYLKGDFAGADRRWRDCLDASDRDPASRTDCLMAVELTRARKAAKTPAPEAAASGAQKAQQAYLEGLVDFQNGDFAKARERWSACAERDDDCRAGLGMLDQSPGSSTVPDEKK